MKTKKQVRQGDVLIERISSIPSNLKQLPGAILAHGEATGHAHVIEESQAVTLLAPTDSDSRSGSVKFMRLTQSSVVKHQEHAPIPMQKGQYKITRQRVYSPEAIRNVAD